METCPDSMARRSFVFYLYFFFPWSLPLRFATTRHFVSSRFAAPALPRMWEAEESEPSGQQNFLFDTSHPSIGREFKGSIDY